MSKELVTWLRSAAAAGEEPVVFTEVADTIERLERERDEARVLLLRMRDLLLADALDDGGAR